MKWILIGIGVILFLALLLRLWWPHFTGTSGVLAVETDRDAAYLHPDTTPWQSFLSAVVDERGLVRYHVARYPARHYLSAYLDQVEKATPSRFKTDEERLAFYINAYNAMVIEGVLRHWPIGSVNDAGPFHKFFREKAYRLAGVRVSLHGLETKIIRNYDARLHFALNCASASCPVLSREAYRAETLDTQLERAAQKFINDGTRNRFNTQTGSWSLSKIFEWYADDFGGEQGVRGLVRKHTWFDWPQDAPFTYEDYDWTLNKSDGQSRR